jgi:predicted DNA-binding transcriptional regulator YafY
LKEGFGCDNKILADLQKATMEGRRISVAYDVYSEGGVKQYTLDPYQIYFKRRALYVDAYSVEEKGYRVYRVNRIKRLQSLGMIVPRRTDYSFASRHRDSFSVFVGDKVEKVKIRFSKKVAPYIKETCWHLSQKITNQKDASIIFEVEVSEPKEVGWWVMQWGEEAAVLEPKSLREMVRTTAERMVHIYDG